MIHGHGWISIRWIRKREERTRTRFVTKCTQILCAISTFAPHELGRVETWGHVTPNLVGFPAFCQLQATTKGSRRCAKVAWHPSIGIEVKGVSEWAVKHEKELTGTRAVLVSKCSDVCLRDPGGYTTHISHVV